MHKSNWRFERGKINKCRKQEKPSVQIQRVWLPSGIFDRSTMQTKEIIVIT